MNISPTQSGYQLIQQSNRMTEEAAREINQQNSQPDQTNNITNQQNTTAVSTLPQSIQESSATEKNREDYVEPMLKLQQADQYSKAGANIIQREQAMIGSLLDTRV